MSQVSVTARAHREDGLWVIEINGYGVTQAVRLADIEMMTQDYVACIDDIPADGVEVSTVVELPLEVLEAKAARAAADAANADAARKLRAAVVGMRRSGWPVSEIAQALGITAGRVSQLAVAAENGPFPVVRRRPRTSATTGRFAVAGVTRAQGVAPAASAARVTTAAPRGISASAKAKGPRAQSS